MSLDQYYNMDQATAAAINEMCAEDEESYFAKVLTVNEALERERSGRMLRRAESLMQAILDDDRWHYEPAMVDINAPLALIQVHMKGQMQALHQVVRAYHETEDQEV